jgi:hypothetical protein
MKSWWTLSANVAMAGLEAQNVIALRLMKLGSGGPAAAAEARLMISEKVLASAEATATLAAGGSIDAVLSRYRAIMRANRRRLSR